MRLVKKILLVLLVLVVALQAPFIYRRYILKSVAEKISQTEKLRTERKSYPEYNEYKGIVHAHTSLGGHSSGSFDELINAANANGLDFVLMAEHYSDAYDTSAMTLNGIYGKTLFVGGNEIDTADSDRLLMIPGSAEAASLRKISTLAALEKLRSENRAAFVTNAEKFNSWNTDFDGIEVFNLHANAKKMNPFTAAFDIIWSFPAYPELTLASYLRRPDENLQKFDETASKRKTALIAGTDAHSNIGFHLVGDDAGNKLINTKLDRYETIFRPVRQHVLVEKNKSLTKENLIDALKQGRSFIGFDALGDTTGFSFIGLSGGNTRTMGEEIALSEDIQLQAAAPLPSRFVVFKNGVKLNETADTSEISFSVNEPAAYRVEVYRDDLGPPFDKMPWIISNPIYVR